MKAGQIDSSTTCVATSKQLEKCMNFTVIIRNTNTGERKTVGIKAASMREAKQIAYSLHCKKQIDIIETVF